MWCRKAALKKDGEITPETLEVLFVLYPSIDKTKMTRAASPDQIYGYGFPSFTLTNSNARIKNQAARVAELERQEAVRESGVKAEVFEIVSGVVAFDYAENRINVKHDEKPERAIIDIVKAHGFRWSRNYGTWTRKMTPNAKYSAKHLIKALSGEPTT